MNGMCSSNHRLGMLLLASHSPLLQVVDGPDTKRNGQGNSSERKDENWCVASVQRRSDTIPNLLGVSPARTGALWATESWSLLFKVQASAFGLERKKTTEHQTNDATHDEATRFLRNQTYPVVNVTAILADPFSLPVFGFFFGHGLLGLGLFVSKDIQAGC